MKQEIAKQWTEALRSGEYNHGRRALCRRREDDSLEHCCLGVLFEILGLSKHLSLTGNEFRYTDSKALNSSISVLSMKAVSMAGIKTGTGLYARENGSLTSLSIENDSFIGEGGLLYMADIIERHWEEL